MAGHGICRKNTAVPRPLSVCLVPAALGSHTELCHTFGKQHPHGFSLLGEDTMRVYYAVVESLLTLPKPSAYPLNPYSTVTKY